MSPSQRGSRLTLLGAAGEVTGSCYLVEAGGARFLIEHGMFQGGGDAGRKNRRSLPVAPGEIDFVVLSHAHIDHSGLLPRLAALGFHGPVYATPATCDLLRVMLPDSAHLQEKEAEREVRRALRRRGRSVEPLYTVRQAQDCLRLLRPAAYDEEVRPHEGVRFSFRDAGHILGSALVEAWMSRDRGETKLVFSGDLGQPGHPIVRDPKAIDYADLLLIESTYGNRNHKNLAQTLDEFAFALNDTLASRKGNVVIPAFAVGRTQEILQIIHRLRGEGRIGAAEVYVDSPMAQAATRITLDHPELQDAGTGEFTAWLKSGGGSGLRLHFTEDTEASMAINSVASGAIIISASGMCDGGRIRHHLRYNLPREQCSVVFAGFQAAGTLGRRIVDGAKTVRIFGEPYPVRARIFTIGGLSAHADRHALLGWAGKFSMPPRRCPVVHGEPLAAHALRSALNELPGWRAEVASHGQSLAF